MLGTEQGFSRTSLSLGLSDVFSRLDSIWEEKSVEARGPPLGLLATGLGAGDAGGARVV